MIRIKEVIEEKLSEVDNPKYIKIDSFTYASLIEEEGINPLEQFDDYLGYPIEVDPYGSDFIEIVPEDEY
jgi:hypothetical protein